MTREALALEKSKEQDHDLTYVSFTTPFGLEAEQTCHQRVVCGCLGNLPTHWQLARARSRYIAEAEEPPLGLRLP